MVMLAGYESSQHCAVVVHEGSSKSDVLLM